MLTLNEQQLKELNDFLQEMPVKYGMPILNYLNAKIKEQNQVSGENVPKENE